MGQCHSGSTTGSTNTLTEIPSLHTPHTQLLQTQDMAEDYSDDFDEEDEDENEYFSDNDNPAYQEDISLRWSKL